jgi:2,3-diketo-5-methylthio-1-phosphopentane phosphatase
MNGARHRNVLVSDFDGTITRHDVYRLIADRCLAGMEPDHYFNEYRAGRISHFEAMGSYFAHFPEDDAAQRELLRATEPPPDLAALAARLRAAGWDLVVLSAGSAWYIQRILDGAGAQAVIYANPGRIVAGRGLVVERPVDSPFFDPEVGISKAAVVRDALSRYERVAFAGDGPPDVAPALLVGPELRFAKSYLAQELERRGEQFLPYAGWADVVEALARRPESNTRHNGE